MFFIVYALMLVFSLCAFQPPAQQYTRLKLDLQEYFTAKLLHYIRDNKYKEFVALLDQAIIVNPHQNFCGNKNLLHHAAQQKRSTFIDYLLSLGLDVRQKDLHGYSVIWHLTSSISPGDDPSDIIPSAVLLVGSGAIFECASKEFCPYDSADREKILKEVFSLLQKSKLA